VFRAGCTCSCGPCGPHPRRPRRRPKDLCIHNEGTALDRRHRRRNSTRLTAPQTISPTTGAQLADALTSSAEYTTASGPLPLRMRSIGTQCPRFAAGQGRTQEPATAKKAFTYPNKPANQSKKANRRPTSMRPLKSTCGPLETSQSWSGRARAAPSKTRAAPCGPLRNSLRRRKKHRKKAARIFTIKR